MQASFLTPGTDGSEEKNSYFSGWQTGGTIQTTMMLKKHCNYFYFATRKEISSFPQLPCYCPRLVVVGWKWAITSQLYWNDGTSHISCLTHFDTAASNRLPEIGRWTVAQKYLPSVLHRQIRCKAPAALSRNVAYTSSSLSQWHKIQIKWDDMECERNTD